MLGSGEGSEKQAFVTSGSTSKKEEKVTERNSSPSGLAAKLQQEVHALANDVVLETEQRQQLATRENVYDEQGNITDLLFHQNGKSINLKSLLPGTYLIEITTNEQTRSEADRKENKIRVNTANGRDFNLSLLHEAGHMVDFQTNQSLYQQLEKDALKARLSEILLTSKILEMRDGEKKIPETISFCHKIVAEEKVNFTPDEIKEIITVIEQTCQHVTQEHPIEALEQERDMQNDVVLRTSTREEVQKERNAWANALKALRTSKQQGITLFVGTQEILFQTIEQALDTYEFISGENLLQTDRHFIRDLSIK